MRPLIAYLDPATGTLIISAIVGGFAAAAMFIKRFWYRMKRAVLRTDRDTSLSSETVAEES